MFYSIHISRLTCSISILECSIYFMSMTFQNLNWFLCTITVFKLMARPFLLLWCLYLTMTHNLGIGNLPCNTFVQVLHVRSLCSCYWDKSRLAHPEKAIFSNKVQWYILWSVEYRYNKNILYKYLYRTVYTIWWDRNISWYTLTSLWVIKTV